MASAPQDLITLDSIGSTQFYVSNNRGVGTYTPKGAFTLKGTYETEGTFLTHPLFSAVPLAKTPVAEMGYAPQRVTYSAPIFSTVQTHAMTHRKKEQSLS
jgi:hypothetical protein